MEDVFLYMCWNRRALCLPHRKKPNFPTLYLLNPIVKLGKSLESLSISAIKLDVVVGSSSSFAARISESLKKPYGGYGFSIREHLLVQYAGGILLPSLLTISSEKIIVSSN